MKVCFYWVLMLLLGNLGINFARGQSVTIQKRDLCPRCTFRADVFAEKEETVVNPIMWSSIDYITPDGEYVKKGDLITRFDTGLVTYYMDQMKRETQITGATVAQDLAAGKNKDHDLRDQLAELLDKRSYLEAKLQRYRSVPLEDEVRIAEGRFHVAQLRYDAAAQNLEKGRDRLKRGMISQANLNTYEKEFREMEANLEFARDELETAKLPTSSRLLRKTELEKTNADLEIDKVRDEIKKNQKLMDFQKKSAEAKRNLITQQIKEKQEDLDNVKVFAPISGNVMYLSEFKSEFASGGKFWKNMNYMKIPDISTVALKGVMLESDRHYYTEGDEVRVRVSCRPETILKGKVKSFGKIPHDVGEKDESQIKWGDERRGYGIKVYDTVVHLNQPPDWVRPGMHATCEVVSCKGSSGPSVPAGYVKQKGEKYYLSVGGVYRPAEGRIIRGFFVLNDEKLLGQKVDLYGRFTETTEQSFRRSAGGRFMVSGELVPVKTEKVYVKPVWNWPKVTWLIGDNCTVKKSDVIARLDTKEVDDEIKKQTSRIQDLVSEREKLEEKRNLKLKESRFTLTKERNNLEIAKLDLEILQSGRDLTAIAKAQLDLKQAVINRDYVQRRLTWIKSKSLPVVAPQELRRLEREAKRCGLKFEEAKIKLALLERGPRDLDLSKTQLAYEEQKFKVETLTKQLELDDFEAEANLKKAKIEEEDAQGILKEMKEKKNNCVLKAPVGGLLQYAKIWNAGVISKVNVGSEVGAGFVLMNISEIAQMYIRIEIPEKYLSKVAKGMGVEVDVPSANRRGIPGTITEIEFLFADKRKKDEDVGLYSSHEHLGETVFYARILLSRQKEGALKAGAVADVVFPFETD